jgi:Ser/Thr protein kinase RdoA (MazF antagonist)
LPVSPQFHLYHDDLGPTNIMVDRTENQVRISGIIDWETVAYFPRFFISTKTMVSPAFGLGDEDCDWDRRAAWARLLTKTLEAKGFEGDIAGYRAWKAEAHPVSDSEDET